MVFVQRFLLALLGVAMLVAVHGLVSSLFQSHNWKPMTASDWGTWVGGLGTVAAFVGAIWLASRDGRRREIESKAVARLTAAGMYHQNIDNLVHLQNAIDMFLQLERPPMLNRAAFETFSQFSQSAVRHLQLIRHWTPHELLPLIALAPNFAERIAALQGRVNSVCSIVGSLSALKANRTALISCIVAVREALEKSYLQYDTVNDVFGEIAKGRCNP